MIEYTQATRPLGITTPLGPDALLLVGLRGTEGLSQLYTFQLDLLARGKPPAFTQVLGQPATIRLDAPGCPRRFIHGIIHRFTQKGQVRSPGGPLIRYHMEVGPQLWLLTRRFQSRIFQHLSVPEILEQILKQDWKLNVSFQIRAPFSPRVLCVQYRETDFAFVSRLMEEEGLHYYFEHTADGHQMIVTDGPKLHPTLPDPSRLRYEGMEGGLREPRITVWEKTQELRACKYTLWDQHCELPGAHLEGVGQAFHPVAVGKASHQLNLQHQIDNQEMLEIYDYPGGYAHRFDGIDRTGAQTPDEMKKIYTDSARVARIRIEQEAAQALIIEGNSDIGHILPGFNFTLADHFDGDGDYLLTRVEHDARLEGTYLTEGGQFHYHNHFHCLPVTVPFRAPSATPRPRVQGSQTATVVGPEGQKIHCDKHGRVKVQFPWDRTGYNETAGANHVLHDSSCWVRVSQTWAGKTFGAIHIPRVGQEVIVDFLEGDPDRPIIVGCVYNANQTPPFALPQHATHSGIKSHTPGNDINAFSHLTFEDYPNAEHVHLHSERDMTHSTEGHLVQNVGREHHQHIGSLSYRQVGGLPGRDHALWIGKNAMGATPSATNPDPTGDDQQDQDSSDDSSASGPYYTISPSQLTSGWAQDLDIVLGWRTGNTLGLYTTLKFGINQSTTINPFAMLDYFSQDNMGSKILSGIAGILSPVTALTRNSMGVINVIFGVNSSIHYGRKIDIQRGPVMEIRESMSGGKGRLAKLMGLVYTLAVLNEVFLPVEQDELASTDAFSDASGAWLAGVTAALDVIAFHIWAALEAETWYLSFLTPGLMWITVGTVETIKSGLARAQAAWNTVVNFPGQVRGAVARMAFPLGDADDNADKAVCCDRSHTINAAVLTLVSAPTSDNAEDPVGIVIQALGLDGMDGEVVVSGSGKATLIGGAEASVQCTTAEAVIGTVTIDCGAAGTIVLQSGLTQEPNCVQLSPTGISLSSLLEIKASVEVNEVMINPALISLSAALSAIEITPEGVTISCGPSLIEITPEGVTISGPMITISGEALTEIR